MWGVDYISFHLPSRPRRLDFASLHSRHPVHVKRKWVERQAKNSPISGVAEDSMPRRDQIQDFYFQAEFPNEAACGSKQSSA